LDRIAARIAPIVRDQLAARAEAELRRQFDERLLAAVREQVDAIVARELPQQLQALSAQGTQPDGVTAADVVACIEMLLGRTPERELVAYHLGLGFRDRIVLAERDGAPRRPPAGPARYSSATGCSLLRIAAGSCILRRPMSI
jgi:hypothetical protein